MCNSQMFAEVRPGVESLWAMRTLKRPAAQMAVHMSFELDRLAELLTTRSARKTMIPPMYDIFMLFPTVSTGEHP